MRTFSTICALLVFNSSFSQQSDTKYTIKEVGWTLVLPADFKVADSPNNDVMAERVKKTIEEANDIKAEFSQTTILIRATKNANNYFSSTIETFNEKKDGEFDISNQISKDIVYKSFSRRIPGAKIDSASTNEEIAGLNFEKFHLTVSVRDKILFNVCILSKYYEGYDFGISYRYSDDETKEQIETMLRNSRFVSRD
jgi:hypothetical protein